MVYDGHNHIGQGPVEQAKFLSLMDKAGVAKTVMFSQYPDRGHYTGRELASFNEARLDNLLAWTKGTDRLVPVYFINPIEADALDQVDRAVERGVVGFKVICQNHMPGDERAMPVYARIAALNKPILFHSGILWGPGPNAHFNRPGNFEAMLLVPGLRFALAHVGWPWCDEEIAVFGKFLAMEREGYLNGQKMYIDLTPGTPPIYRQEVLTKLLTVGYQGIEKRLIFGIDGNTDTYNPEYGQDWIARDTLIYQDMSLDPKIVECIFWQNCRDFWGID